MPRLNQARLAWLTRLLAVAVLLAFTIEPAAAQPDTVALRAQVCDTAIQAVTAGTWQAGKTWAPTYLSRCGQSGRQTLAAGVRTARSTTDSTTLAEMFGSAALTGDTAVFEALADVALNATGTAASRVYAIHALLGFYEPGRDFSPAGLVALTAPADCWPTAGSRLAPHAVTTVGVTRRAQVRTAVEALAGTLGAPPPVRTAAACVAAAGVRDPA
ncbi:hypothetical protein [Roseisolibacter agri]|uniref:Rap1a immunity protein domain-containing protein n=1 Tax=Roseisolibacter agri TaxID=2014610 RepID=A0AA37QG52_9BACT|nr:hypothetical protein [Roseisolibacter agri]GLC28281.1 hypothetical protein rosag_47940 [Roseisolibacter agri]